MNKRDFLKGLGLVGAVVIAKQSSSDDAIEGELLPPEGSAEFIARSYYRGKKVHEKRVNLRSSTVRRDGAIVAAYGVLEFVTVVDGQHPPMRIDEFRLYVPAIDFEKVLPKCEWDSGPWYIGKDNTVTLQGDAHGLLTIES